MPEEQNRVLTDHISDLLLCPTQTAVDNLKKEGITFGVLKTGDIMYDAVLRNVDIAKKRYADSAWFAELREENAGIPALKEKEYYLATIHRAENTDDLEKLKREGYTDAFISLGSVGNTSSRRRLFELIVSLGFEIPNIIDSSAIVSRNSILGNGIFIGKHTMVNAGSVLKNGVIINSSATIEHDCVIGAFAHISPGVVLCGNVTIGSDTHVGAGSVVRQQINVGSNTMVGMGSIVLHDIPDKMVAYGNPCRVVRSL